MDSALKAEPAAVRREIERVLKVITGLPFSATGRAASLVWFGFGPYAISTESAWHIATPKGGIIVASQDRFYPAGNDPDNEPPDFDWDKAGANRCDARMKKLLDQHAPRPLLVNAIKAMKWGGLRISLTHEYVLEIFNHTSLDCEYWRLFHESERGRGIVVTAHGVER